MATALLILAAVIAAPALIWLMSAVVRNCQVGRVSELGNVQQAVFGRPRNATLAAWAGGAVVAVGLTLGFNANTPLASGSPDGLVAGCYRLNNHGSISCVTAHQYQILVMSMQRGFASVLLWLSLAMMLGAICAVRPASTRSPASGGHRRADTRLGSV